MFNATGVRKRKVRHELHQKVSSTVQAAQRYVSSSPPPPTGIVARLQPSSLRRVVHHLATVAHAHAVQVLRNALAACSSRSPASPTRPVASVALHQRPPHAEALAAHSAPLQRQSFAAQQHGGDGGPVRVPHRVAQRRRQRELLRPHRLAQTQLPRSRAPPPTLCMYTRSPSRSA